MGAEKDLLEQQKVPVLRILEQVDGHYLTNSDRARIRWTDHLFPQDSILFRVDEITYEEEAPWKEALENVLSAVRIPGVTFIYLLLGWQDRVEFYYGLCRDYTTPLDSDLSIAELGQNVLQASIAGNFRGSSIVEIKPEVKDNIFKKLSKMEYISRIEGVAGSVKDDERFQSVDRLVDVMQGEIFCLAVVARALDAGQAAAVEQDVNAAYNVLSPYLKYSRQNGESEGKSGSKSQTDGKNTGKSTNRNTTVTQQSSSSTTTTENSGSSYSKATQNQTGKSGSEQTGTGTSEGESHGFSEQEGWNSGKSTATTREYLDRRVQEWLKYCDDVILPRLDYGKGKGLFVTTLYAMAKGRSTQAKLENTVLSLYSGKQGNKVPLRAFPLAGQKKSRNPSYILQIPQGGFAPEMTDEERIARSFLSQYVMPNGDFVLGNWITTNELAMIAGLPRKEVVGLRLREEVEFGLNSTPPEPKDRIALGNLVQNGREICTPVYLDRQALNKHLFVAGVTGSGKTTTCQKILLNSKLPFLVIEPAKTEYRIMKKSPDCSDLLVFTLGDDSVAPFRMNPLEFLPGESITAHVDMLKASIEAAFDMEAAIPQLIESALYRCYEKCGWDIDTQKNSSYTDPFAPDSAAFPTLSDLLAAIPEVVEDQGFDSRLKNDYIGSIRARLQGLTLGAKGHMLNTKRSIDWDALLDKKVVFELEGVKSGSEKSLIMGFILTAFHEAVRERYQKSGRPHAHILLVEEAHRLLSKYMPGDSLNKKHGVEMFSDMLAEIRKYGQCLIIADQIPNKMAEDVLKNTNTKLVHRIFAQDDKDAIGNTMSLSHDQKQFLSNLGAGRAIFFTDGVGEAMQIQIVPETDTDGLPLPDQEFSQRALCYYREECRMRTFMPLRGEFSGLTEGDCACALGFVQYNIPYKMLMLTHKENGWNAGWASDLKKLLDLGLTTAADLAEWSILHFPLLAAMKGTEREKPLLEAVRAYFEAYPQGKDAINKTDIKDYF